MWRRSSPHFFRTPASCRLGADAGGRGAEGSRCGVFQSQNETALFNKLTPLSWKPQSG